MSLVKFRRVEDMPRPPRVTGVALAQHIAAAWERAQAGGRRPIPPGVQRFRTIEEAQAARAEHQRRYIRERRERNRG